MTRDDQDYYREEDFEDIRRKRDSGRPKAAVAITIIMTIAVLVLTVFLLFHVREIRVTGNRYVSEAEVVRWIQQDTMATNSLYILFQQKFGDRDELPLVEDTVVSLKSPWIVQVTVHEKEIVGYLENNGQRIYFDGDGGVVLISEEEPMEGISRVDGMDVDMAKVKEHEDMPINNPEALELLTRIKDTLKKTELTPDSITISGSDVSLIFGVVTVNLGSVDLETRIAQIPPVLSTLNERYPGTSGIIHLENYNTSVKRIGFTPTPAPVDAPAEEETTDETQGTGEEWIDPTAQQWIE